MTRVDVLVDRLRDERSRQVVFLSHCLLNENTRYLGGACRRCCVREVVEQCMERGIGMVQMPCPEREVWGGVLKRKLLFLYGAQRRSALVGRLAPALLPLVLGYVRLRYRRIARRVVDEVDDYIRSGFSVVGIVGIDGSPTCGLHRTIDAPAFVRSMSRVDLTTFTVREQNDLVRRHATPGRGIFMEELVRELDARHLDVPLLAHDLLGELDGRPSNVIISSQLLRERQR
jgi:predicted secreted protein